MTSLGLAQMSALIGIPTSPQAPNVIMASVAALARN